MEVTISQRLSWEMDLKQGRVPLNPDEDQYCITKNMRKEELVEYLGADKSHRNDRIHCILYDLNYTQMN